jgi:predicted nucleic acid-binding protein
VLFADSSALTRIYLEDERESDELAALLLESDTVTLASELVYVELARALKNAERGGRISSAEAILSVVDADLARSVSLIDLEPATVLPGARELILEYRLGTLDAIHLAVALDEARRADEPLTFVTRDGDQAAAAKALGFELA